jgi:phosphoglycolate phosphatase-like HAD superfamily hydrolase
MSHAAASTLVLFDVDGTLVLTGRAGVRGMNAAFARLYARDGALDAVSIAGRTDRAIVSDVFRSLGVVARDEEVFRLRDAYLEQLRVAIEVPVEHPRGVLPGVAGLIDALAERPDVAVGLLTGNFEGGAAIKLGHFDLWRRFRFGAFGDHHVDRRDLVPLALERAAAAGVPTLRPSRVVVVGDTPLDVGCARAHGARSIGVATGPFGTAALSEAGADLALDTLEDAGRILDWLGS